MSIHVYARVVRMLYVWQGCMYDAAVCGVVVLVVDREPDYISIAARKRDEPARRVCPAVRAFPLRGGQWPPLSRRLGTL